MTHVTLPEEGGPPVHLVHIPTVEHRTKSRERSPSRIAEFYYKVTVACWGAVGRRVDSCRAECYSGVKICRDISDQTEADCQGTVGDQPEMARKQLQMEKNSWLGGRKKLPENNFGQKN